MNHFVQRPSIHPSLHDIHAHVVNCGTVHIFSNQQACRGQGPECRLRSTFHHVGDLGIWASEVHILD